jgi:hypothetical protein
MAFLSGVRILLPFGTVNCVQTLKVLRTPDAGLPIGAAAVAVAGRRREVMLDRQGAGFGFSLNPCQTVDRADFGACVTEVAPGGVVDASKSIFLGDRIVAVNSKVVLEARYDEIVSLLREDGIITLIVEAFAAGGGTYKADVTPSGVHVGAHAGETTVQLQRAAGASYVVIALSSEVVLSRGMMEEHARVL